MNQLAEPPVQNSMHACVRMCNLCIATKITTYILPVLAKQYAHMLT